MPNAYRIPPNIPPPAQSLPHLAACFGNTECKTHSTKINNTKLWVGQPGSLLAYKVNYAAGRSTSKTLRYIGWSTIRLRHGISIALERSLTLQ